MARRTIPLEEKIEKAQEEVAVVKEINYCTSIDCTAVLKTHSLKRIIRFLNKNLEYVKRELNLNLDVLGGILEMRVGVFR